jgi:hypothetical protein
MAKKNIKKAMKQPAAETAAKQSRTTAAIGETAAEKANALKPPAPAVTAKPPTTPAGVPLQTLTPVAPSKPSQPPAQQGQNAPAKAAVAQGSLTTAAQSPKPAAQPEPIKLPETAAVGAEAPMPSEVPTVKVTFVFPLCQCCPKRVSLSGDFNGWSPDATPMKRHDDGHWETTFELAPGRYEYKFVRDGEWMPDLLAHENILNRHGTLNSVIEVRG